MRACEDRLAKRVSVMIFPEGTRSADGELGPFLRGAFKLAIDRQVPILPLAVHGTSTALRKHDWRLGVSNADVYVLDPIDTTGMTSADVNALRDRVRATIAAKLNEVAPSTPQQRSSTSTRTRPVARAGQIDVLVRRPATVGGIGEHVVDGEVSPSATRGAQPA